MFRQKYNIISYILVVAAFADGVIAVFSFDAIFPVKSTDECRDFILKKKQSQNKTLFISCKKKYILLV